MAAAAQRPVARPLAPAEALRQRNIAALARALYNEARGNGRDAMVAVAHTVRNRMLRKGATSVEQVWGEYAHAIPHPTKSPDIEAYVSGGLESIPGVHDIKTDRPVRNYRPGWSVDSQFERRMTPDFPEQDFKFDRSTDGGAGVR